MTTTALHLTINDHAFTTMDDDQLASDLILLVGENPAMVDLFRLRKDGTEHHIKGDVIVDLQDGEKFVTRHKVRFTVDGEKLTSWDDDLTAGSILRRVGLDPTQYDLARVTGGHAQVFAAEEVVAIADGDEFVTAKRVGGVA